MLVEDPDEVAEYFQVGGSAHVHLRAVSEILVVKIFGRSLWYYN